MDVNHAALIEIGARRPGLTVRVAPAHGGRTVGLRTPGGAELIDAGPNDWSAPTGAAARPDAEWSQDFAQVVWLAPQAEFWAGQTALPDRPADAMGWPPDPVTTHGAYEVIERTPGFLRLRGPASPVWQVQLTKTWEALPDGAIRFSVEARNISARPIRKGLWFNFRARPEARVSVPVGPGHAWHVEGGGDLRLAVEGGWLAVRPPLLPPGADFADAKVFVRPTRGEIRVEAPGGWLELTFPLAAAVEVSAGHAPVEIYRKVNRGSWSILEVEQHAPCVMLAPGETMRHEETWRWRPGSQ